MYYIFTLGRKKNVRVVQLKYNIILAKYFERFMTKLFVLNQIIINEFAEIFISIVIFH